MPINALQPNGCALAVCRVVLVGSGASGTSRVVRIVLDTSRLPTTPVTMAGAADQIVTLIAPWGRTWSLTAAQWPGSRLVPAGGTTPEEKP